MGILFIDLGEVRTFELNGSRTIGRDGSNDIVVTHPTVSRMHARIEPVNGSYQIVDFKSRNGTRINGKAVTDPETLIDGARMRIGHVRAWFFKEMPEKLPRSITNRDRGIVFNCACGQRLWSASDTAGMAVTCGGCNKSVEVPEKSVAPLDDSGGTVAGVVVEETKTAPEVVCGVCHWPVEAGEKRHKCPSCGLDFHLDCWKENHGCSAYGCNQVNALAPKKRPATPTIGPVVKDKPVVIAPPVPQPLAWAHALLALAVVGSLLGTLSFGIPSGIVGLIALVRLLASRTDKKAVLFAVVLIAALGTGAGVLISRFWWWDLPLIPSF